MRDFHLESEFSFKNRFSRKNHPNLLDLNIMGNVYKFAFKNESTQDEGTIMKSIVYNEARLINSEGNAKYRNISYPNSFLLKE